MKKNLLYVGILAGLLTNPFFSCAYAAEETSSPVYMEADKLGYDQKNALVLALGKVEIVQDTRILRADKVIYYQEQNIVRATGNVSLLDEEGNVYFANDLEITNDLKQGVIQQFRIRLKDNSLFAAREAHREDEKHFTLKKAVYSPCKLCEPKEGEDAKAPLWQIKASKVKYDEQEQKVTYNNARLEVYGVPVLWSPVFMHPTPGADRKTGILAPEYSHSTQLGTTFKLPVYYNIAPDKDATITPYLTSKSGPVLMGQYRQLTDNGSYEFDGSGTYPDRLDADGREISGRDFRGHIFAKGDSDINDKWNWGFDVNRSSDDTYLRRYKFSNDTSLTSRAFAERIEGRNYLRLQGLTFQGLRVEDNPDYEPLIAPEMQAHLETTAGFSDSKLANSKIYMDADSMILSRIKGADSRRISATLGWKLPYITDNGQIFELDTSYRSDAYSLSDVALNNGDSFSGTKNRFVPQASLSWRYPMLKRVSNANLIVEPIVMAVASKNHNNPYVINNEDSRTPEFTESNLFSANRFAGRDLIENGSRVIYGARTSLQDDQAHNASLMLGQERRLNGEQAVADMSGDNGNNSDYVGEIAVNYLPVNLSYRLKIDSENFSLPYSEIHSSYNANSFGFGADYIRLNNDIYLGTKEEIMENGWLMLSENWKWTAFGRHDLAGGRRNISAGSGLVYTDECLTIYTDLAREFTRDRDIAPGTSISVRLGLKNLN